MLHVIVRLPACLPDGGDDGLLYARGNAGGSLVAFGLFLEDRDLRSLLFFPEVLTEEKRRAQRQHRQQEFEEAFHQNLPSIILLKTREKSIAHVPISGICFFAQPPIY
jgi:hypothetical protein